LCIETKGLFVSEELQARFTQVIDGEDIRRLLYEYAFYLDMNQTEDLANLFVEDCEVIYGPTYGANGIEEYRKTLEGVGTFFSGTSHHVSNTVIDFASEDTANVRSVLYAWHGYNRDRPDGHLMGQYHDVVVRVDGRWRFKRRELRVAGTKDFHVKDNLPIGRKG
jgi:ketosteroid isomerase-like protein